MHSITVRKGLAVLLHFVTILLFIQKHCKNEFERCYLRKLWAKKQIATIWVQEKIAILKPVKQQVARF